MGIVMLTLAWVCTFSDDVCYDDRNYRICRLLVMGVPRVAFLFAHHIAQSDIRLA